MKEKTSAAKVNGSTNRKATKARPALAVVKEATTKPDDPDRALRLAAGAALRPLIEREPTRSELDALAKKIDLSVYYAARKTGAWPKASEAEIAKRTRLHATVEAAVKECRLDAETVDDAILGHSPSPWERMRARAHGLSNAVADGRPAMRALVECCAWTIGDLSPWSKDKGRPTLDEEDQDKLDAVRSFIAAVVSIAGLTRIRLSECPDEVADEEEAV